MASDIQAIHWPLFDHFMSSVKAFLRGLMKLRSTVFNIKALQNHLMLTKRQALVVDSFAQVLDLTKTSILIMMYPNGEMTIDVSPEKQATHSQDAQFSKECHGIMVGVYQELVSEPVVTIHAPHHLLKKGAPDAGHSVYIIALTSLARTKSFRKCGGYTEIATENTPDKYNGCRIPFDVATKGRIACYVGKTSRGITNRLDQHIRSALRGSQTKFHRVMRGSEKYEPSLISLHLVAQTPTEDQAYEFEAKLIENTVSDDRVYVCNTVGASIALNDLLEAKPNLRGKVSAEYAEEYLVELSARSSEAWDDPETATATICNNSRNFDADEVRLMRFLLRSGKPVSVIAKDMGVNPSRVSKLQKTKTYRRVV